MEYPTSRLLENDDAYSKDLGLLKEKILKRLPAGVLKNRKNFDSELFVRLIRERWINRDYDCYIAITGNKGTGKSTLSLRMALYYSKLFLNKNFNLRKNIIYTPLVDEIFKKVKNAVDSDVFIFDEASRIILAEEWNKIEHRELKKIFAEIRTKHLFIIFTCPFQFQNIDGKYRNSLLKYWVHCFDRNFGAIFQQNISPAGDAFHIEWFKKRMRFLSVNALFDFRTYGLISSHPCFYHSVRWTPLPKHIYERYLALRDRFVYDRDVGEEIQQEINMNLSREKEKLMVTVANLKVKGYSDNEIIKITGLSRYSIMKYLASDKAREIISDVVKNVEQQNEAEEKSFENMKSEIAKRRKRHGLPFNVEEKM